MRQPHNFAAVLESSLSDASFVLDLLSSVQSSKYEFEPALLAKVVASLSLDDRAHVLVHARLLQILQNDESSCLPLLDSLPLHLNTEGVESDVVMLLIDVFDNVLIYSLLVNTLCIDYTARGRRSRFAVSCFFAGFERKPAQLVACEAICTPFKYEMSWMYRDTSIKLLDMVLGLGGIRCFAERAAVELTDQQFIVLCRHVCVEKRLALLVQYMLVKNMTDTTDIYKCAAQMKNVDRKSAVKFEFLKNILMSSNGGDEKEEIKKKNKNL